MRHRPFVWCVCWLVCGTALLHKVSPNIYVVMLAIGASCAIAGLFFRGMRWIASAGGMLGAGLLLAATADLTSQGPDELGALAGTNGSRPVELIGIVEPGVRWNDAIGRARVGLAVEQVKVDGAWHPWSGRTLWSWYDAPRVPVAGEHVHLTGRLRNATGWRNFGLFDYGTYLRRQGFHTSFYTGATDSVVTLGQVDLPPRQRWVVAVRERAASAIARVPADRDVHGVLLTVLVGDRRWLSDDVREVTEATGTYHLLSISGLHVGIVAGWLLAAARLFPRRSMAGTAVILGGLAAYAVLTGGAVPVVRASIMCAVAVVLLRMRRPPDSTSILAVAAAIILALDPVAFHSAGTQLSFAATAALVWFLPRSALWVVQRVRTLLPRKTHTAATWLTYAVLAPLIVQLAIAPLLLWHFQQLPTLSVVANVIATPLLFVMIASALATVVAAGVHPIAAQLPGVCAALSGSSLLAWLEWVAAVRVGPELFAVPNPLVVVTVGSVAFLCWRLASRRPALRAASVGLWLGVMLLGPLPRWQRGLEIHVLDVGHGSATLVEFPNGKTMLVDGGRRSRTFDVGKMIVEPYLLRRGVRKLDVVVATHPQNDHIGGLIHVVERFPVREVWVNGDVLDTWTSRRFSEACENVAVRTVSRGEVFDFEGASVHVLNPALPLLKNAANATNNNSIVLRVDYGNAAVALTGDASESLGEALESAHPWPERVLVQAPHHGVPRPRTMKALEGLHPIVSWASLTATWPDRRVLEGHANALSQWRTDRHGGLRVFLAPDGSITIESATGLTQAWPASAEERAPLRVAAPLRTHL